MGTLHCCIIKRIGSVANLVLSVMLRYRKSLFTLLKPNPEVTVKAFSLLLDFEHRCLTL